MAYLQDIRHHSNWFANFHSDTSIVHIISDPVNKPAFSNFEGDVKMIKKNGIWINTRGHIIIQTNCTNPQITKGSTILIVSKPFLIKAKGTYKGYLQQKNIFHRYYLQKGNHEILITSKEVSFIVKCRKRILSILDQYIQDPESNALSKALLIGYRIEMDKNTLEAFRNTGVIHVISVSGMHLALIYALLNGFLKFIFSKTITGRIQRIGINLFVLWIFSILCGGSSSVLRSAVMFTFILFGELLNKKNFTSNAIAGSAFFLLCIDPSMLKDLGFLLSYAAVLGLHIYNKPISHLLYSKNKILMHGWELFSTSVSAQVLTAPIIIHEFGKFPALFLLSNLIAVPVTSLLLLTLIILCIFTSLHIPAVFIGHFIEKLSQWLIKKMNILGNLPISIIHIHIDLPETIILFTSILLITVFISTRKTLFFWYFLFTNLIWSIYVMFIKWVNIH